MSDKEYYAKHKARICARMQRNKLRESYFNHLILNDPLLLEALRLRIMKEYKMGLYR
jgi:hypothetical protein